MYIKMTESCSDLYLDVTIYDYRIGRRATQDLTLEKERERKHEPSQDSKLTKIVKVFAFLVESCSGPALQL